MTDVVNASGEAGDEAMPVYRPGLSLVESVKGAAGRFFPGALVSLTAVLSMLEGVPGSGELGETVLTILAGAAAMTAGFGTGLEGLRRWLYPDAKISGRKSFIAGLMAPIAVFVAGALLSIPLGLAGILTLLFVVPCALAVLMFFAWLTPTPEALRDGEYVEPDELPGLMLRSWPSDGSEGVHPG